MKRVVSLCVEKVKSTKVKVPSSDYNIPQSHLSQEIPHYFEETTPQLLSLPQKPSKSFKNHIKSSLPWKFTSFLYNKSSDLLSRELEIDNELKRNEDSKGKSSLTLSTDTEEDYKKVYLIKEKYNIGSGDTTSSSENIERIIIEKHYENIISPSLQIPKSYGEVHIDKPNKILSSSESSSDQSGPFAQYVTNKEESFFEEKNDISNYYGELLLAENEMGIIEHEPIKIIGNISGEGEFHIFKLYTPT